jgi:hydroxyacylglutathione hydrolase
MINFKVFAFNLFYVNTFILYDETAECLIIDPGCQDKREEQKLADFIQENNLKPVRLINTHCHVDHILGNRFIFENYGLRPEIHKDEKIILTSSNCYCEVVGLPLPNSPIPEKYLEDGEEILFGNSKLKVLLTPGHTPGHVSFYSEVEKFVICGDVLFAGSIGRTDLPGGNFDHIIESIKTKLLVLDDDVTVYSGHGQSTQIGYEKRYNPFLF